jgi:hypothetical protein
MSRNRPISVYRLGDLPIQSCGQSVGAPRGKQYTEIGLLRSALPGVRRRCLGVPASSVQCGVRAVSRVSSVWRQCVFSMVILPTVTPPRSVI